MNKKFTSLKIMESFTEKSLPDLDVCTLGALEKFITEGVPKVKLPKFKKALVVGSGNAIVAAKIIFESYDTIFADESNYKSKLNLKPDIAIIFSASGGKHAPIMARELLKKNIKTYLVTCAENSDAEKVIKDKNRVIVTAKNREPYTYNTSTYMGWILAMTHEDPKKIYDFILKEIKPKVQRKDFKKYKGFYLATPNGLGSVNELFITKFVELFARKIPRDVFTYEHSKHATNVVPTNELCIQFGDGEVILESHKFKIPLPKWAGPATLMSIGYFLIGYIQKQNPPYFKKNIANYVKASSKGSFGSVINIIVE